MDRVFYQVVGLIDDQGKPVEGVKGSEILMPQTPDELAEDMRKWVLGEEDEHDQIVTEYKRRVSEQFAAAKREQGIRRRKLAEMHKAREEAGIGPSIMVGYTPEQLQAILSNRQPGPKGVRKVDQGEGQVREHLYTKYIEREPEIPQGFQVESGDLVLGEQEKRSLGPELENRKVTFRTEGEE
jgi:hypothetical protein